MKTITNQEHDWILAARSEGLTSLPPGVFEKDLLVTQVLHTIASADSGGIQLVFCGGTCLAKAHGLIQRMSEDIDFKLIVPEGLSRSARSRRLSQFKKRIASTLNAAGFVTPAEHIIARDENNYIALNVHYASRFAPVASLRPEIKIELNARPPVLPTVSRPIRSMLDALLQAPTPGEPMSCISVQETLAEKILSFLRRTAQALAGRNRAEYDDRLIRHVYDVHAIAHGCPGLVETLPHAHFATLTHADAAQYRNQYPEFADDPLGQMRLALAALQDDTAGFVHDYRQFVDELVFGPPVAFADARAAFVALAQPLLSAAHKTQQSDPG